MGKGGVDNYVRWQIEKLFASNQVTAERPYGLKEAAARLYKTIDDDSLRAVLMTSGATSNFDTVRQLLANAQGPMLAANVIRAVVIDIFIAYAMQDPDLVRQDEIRLNTYNALVAERSGPRPVGPLHER